MRFERFGSQFHVMNWSVYSNARRTEDANFNAYHLKICTA